MLLLMVRFLNASSCAMFLYGPPDTRSAIQNTHLHMRSQGESHSIESDDGRRVRHDHVTQLHQLLAPWG